ncbi:thiol-disulfide oxidoreductase [Pseudovibrio japonicus]|uniref:Thiol-disulfide oxidoreductase n=1 Tax=Pseudovibrio japonicus TaxID=366534 RepID=A0ABQ3ERD1_9HYPH|nr:DCC1-like thiol-disulfide oxidoreductase family protein [Pseudovibrio japonicus]GHB46872.1 thiol-disulfide oxidoreductase [Pseudovibrio japonicus]
MKINQQRFSYREDANVPAFPDEGPISVMDATCGLCAKAASWIAHNDRTGDFKIVPLQSDLGEALARHYGVDPTNPSTWLYLEAGSAYTSLDALTRVGSRLGGIWKLLITLRILPSPLQDALYSLVARNRYKLWGRTDLCSLPDPEVQERINIWTVH